MTNRARPTTGTKVEEELACLFSKYLQRKTSGHYASPLRLDVSGRKESAYGQPDFLLEGKGCPNVVVELKRLMAGDISTEKRAELRIRTAVGEALGLNNESLPRGYVLVLRSARTCVPVGGRWRDQLVRRLRNAFKKATSEEPYESRSRPPFELWRMPSDTQPFAVEATTLRPERREFRRLVKNADAKRGIARWLPDGGMYALLFVTTGTSEMTYANAEFWLWRPRLRQWGRPRRVTHIYAFEVREDTVPRVIVSGLWPESNGLSEDIRVSHSRAARFSAYAHGRLRA